MVWIRLKRFIFACAVVVSLIAMCGCRSDLYYQNRAVERAREFLLDEAPELTTEQAYYVKFNDPLLLTGPIYAGMGFSTREAGLSTQLRQICVTWQIPGTTTLYMVYGASSGRMDHWYPVRIIRKNFVSMNLPLYGATKAARAYAVNSLFRSFSSEEYNRIRFTFPWVKVTAFPLSANPNGSASPEEVEKTQKSWSTQTQYSLVWEPDAGRDPIVFCGMSQPDLAGWSVNFAGRISREQLDAATLKTVKSPDEFDTAIQPGEVEVNDITAETLSAAIEQNSKTPEPVVETAPESSASELESLSEEQLP